MIKTTDRAARDFIVRRHDLREFAFVDGASADPAALEDGEILVRIDRFAFTANNVTYAAYGEAMSYWSFFPAPDGFGRIPVWGFGDVIASRHEGIATGERLYGYLPMSSHVVLRPGHVSPSGFVEQTPHRQSLPAAYNQYLRTAGDPGYDRAAEDFQALFRPLFVTSFLIDDFLAEQNFFGASTVLLTSASSKTAFGLAFLLAARRDPKVTVIGLTSPGNIAFCEGLGCYDRVLAYDAIGRLPLHDPCVLVDMAGSGEILSAVHHHLGDNLKYSCRVGAAHWEGKQPSGRGLPGPKPVFFFAPDRLKKRARDWGPGGIERNLAASWQAFVTRARTWISVVHGKGEQDIARVYAQTVDGRVHPHEGHILLF